MAPPPFIDTNVFVRHLVGDQPQHAVLANAFFDRIREGELTARITDTVIFETVFSLVKFYKIPRTEIREQLLKLLDLPGILLPDKHYLKDVFDMFVSRPYLSYADCYHVIQMKRLKLTEIVSFDRGFDRLPDITRTEPS